MAEWGANRPCMPWSALAGPAMHARLAPARTQPRNTGARACARRARGGGGLGGAWQEKLKAALESDRRRRRRTIVSEQEVSAHSEERDGQTFRRPDRQTDTGRHRQTQAGRQAGRQRREWRAANRRRPLGPSVIRHARRRSGSSTSSASARRTAATASAATGAQSRRPPQPLCVRGDRPVRSGSVRENGLGLAASVPLRKRGNRVGRASAVSQPPLPPAGCAGRRAGLPCLMFTSRFRKHGAGVREWWTD